jgi:hypothetical protein
MWEAPLIGNFQLDKQNKKITFFNRQTNVVLTFGPSVNRNLIIELNCEKKIKLN